MQLFQCNTFLELPQKHYAMKEAVAGNGPLHGKTFPIIFIISWRSW